jgi:hypothetical protein
MKAAFRVAIAGMSVLAAAGGMAQSGLQAPTVGEFRIKEINVAEIDTSHVKRRPCLRFTLRCCFEICVLQNRCGE